MTAQPKNICICNVQTLFVRGGAEAQTADLARQCRQRGHSVDEIAFPLLHSPSRNLLSSSLAWRMMDLDAYSDHPIDLVIATKFPAYLVRHQCKIVWLVHQVREAYELFNSEYYYFKNNPEDNEIREMIVTIDNAALPEARTIFTISRNVSNRLKRFNGLDSTVLYPPSPLPIVAKDGPEENFILAVGRLEPIKRFDLLIKAMKYGPSALKAVIVGDGPMRETLDYLVEKLDLTDRITLTGSITTERLVDLYNRCNAVFFAPFDEDYGFVTIEAFQAAKPVITCNDSGGPLEFVNHQQTGLICEPEPHAVADMIGLIVSQPQQARTMGRNGRESVRDITWENVVETLIS